MADDHIAVIGHDHERAGLHGKETIHDEHLKEAGKEADGPQIKPKDGQDLGDDSETDHCVQQGEQAEQVVHGFVQRRLQPDCDQEGDVGPKGQEQEEAKGQGQPVLPDGGPDKTIQKEVSGDAAILVCCHSLSYSSTASFW